MASNILPSNNVLPENPRLSPFASVSSILQEESDDESAYETRSPSPSSSPQKPGESPQGLSSVNYEEEDDADKREINRLLSTQLSTAHEDLQEVLDLRRSEIEAIKKRSSEDRLERLPENEEPNSVKKTDNQGLGSEVKNGLNMNDTQHSMVETFLDTVDHIPGFASQEKTLSLPNENLAAFLK